MILDQFRLDGKIAMVTGVGTGMGQAIAVALAEAGADIVGVYRTHVEETEKIVGELGRGFLRRRIDLAEAAPDDLRNMIDDSIQLMGGLDILVNCAGVIDRIPAVEFPEEVWNRTIQVNLNSVFFLCQAAAQHFMGLGRGKIINIASVLSQQGGILVPAYATTKAAVWNLTKELANEWASHGINVNCIMPGFMATDFTKPLQDDPVRSAGILQRIPAGRWGKPQDVQGAAVFLASSASDYVHGAAIAVDGGWLGR